jgi:hypothetical protein
MKEASQSEVSRMRCSIPVMKVTTMVVSMMAMGVMASTIASAVAGGIIGHIAGATTGTTLAANSVANLTKGAPLILGQQVLPVRVDRWLRLEQLAGSVTTIQGNQSRTARLGDRLQSPGDGVATAKNSSASLMVDTAVGMVDVAENSDVRIQSLEMAPDNGRITRLVMTKGQARLKLRPFTHRGSRLEIRSPASLSGVRGTTFGLVVQPSGKTGLAVQEGGVVSQAVGRSQDIPEGFQNFTIPGEAPTPPVPLKDDPSLEYDFNRVIQAGVRRVQLVGKVDPVNFVSVDGVPQTTDREGRFRTALQPLPGSLRFQVVVITPLGKQQTYQIVFR